MINIKSVKLAVILLSFVVVLITCRKDEENPTGGNRIEIGVNLIDTVSYFFTTIQTEVKSLGGQEIIEHGHCWSKESEPTLENDFTTLGELSTVHDFLSEIDSLLPNTSYYLRPYLRSSYSVVYGEEEEIKTLKTGKPVVVSNLVTDITFTSAISGGTVTFDSGLVVTSRGLCWDTTDVVLIDSYLGFTIDSLAGLGNYSNQIDNLTEGTTYNLVAYATNEMGTSYGELLSFSTIPINLAQVETFNVTNITTTSAQCGGNVTDAGNGTVAVKGICWDTILNPTIENNLGFTEDGSGLGEFTSYIIDIEEGTTYYVAAYATNEQGTAYGEVKSFSSIPILPPTVITKDVSNIMSTSAQCGGNVTDAGNGTVAVKGICWDTIPNPTIENNLGFTEDGSGLGEFTSYIIDIEEGTTYYVAAYAINEKGTGYGEIKSFMATQIIAPDVTTADVNYITMNSATCGGNVITNGNGTVSTRGVCWNITGNPTLENNEGFTVDGSGLGIFISQLTELEGATTYYVKAYATNENETGYGQEKTFVTLELTIPFIITDGVSNITSNSATCGGNVITNGNGTVSTRGVCWNITGNPTLENNEGFTVDGSGLGIFISQLTELESTTTYYVKAYATNENGTGYGLTKTFETMELNSYWIQWDNGINNGNAIGLTNGGTFSCASHWEPSDLNPYNGLSLLKIKFYAGNDPNANYTIKVWTGAAGITEVLSQDVGGFVANNWNEIILTTPVSINASYDLWFGYEVTHDAGLFPAGTDNGPAIQFKGDMLNSGGGWVSMSLEWGLDYNFNIAGYVGSSKDSKTFSNEPEKNAVVINSFKSNNFTQKKSNKIKAKNIFKSAK